MNVGEINRGAVALIMVMLLGAGGFLWFSRMYKPAVASRTAATATLETAQTALADAKQKLAAAQQQAEDAKKESAKPDDSVARLAKSRTAIPDRKLIDDAAIVLVELAARSGVQTNFQAGGESTDSTTAETSLSGAVPIDLTFEAAGTYAEMMQFMSQVESTVEERDDKLYTRGRLFNVVGLEIGDKEADDTGGGGDFEDGGGVSAVPEDGIILGPNDIRFTVTVRMYTSSTDNAESVGLATEDPAEAPTDSTGADGVAIDPTTDPAAAGAAGVVADPAANGVDTGAVDGGVPDPAGGSAE